jgi:hypothetical protein
MERAILVTVATAIFLAAIVNGQSTTCPEQTYPAIPAGVDPNRIAVDPHSPDGKRLIVAYLVTTLGQQVRYDGFVCDPDGDTVVLTTEKGTVALRPDTSYTWVYQPTAIGMEYIGISAADVRPMTNDSKTRVGTIVVNVLPANRPPVLCGGRP